MSKTLVWSNQQYSKNYDYFTFPYVYLNLGNFRPSLRVTVCVVCVSKAVGRDTTLFSSGKHKQMEGQTKDMDRLLLKYRSSFEERISRSLRRRSSWWSGPSGFRVNKTLWSISTGFPDLGIGCFVFMLKSDVVVVVVVVVAVVEE